MEQPSRPIAIVLSIITFVIILAGNANAQTIATENVGATRASMVKETIETIEEPTTEMTEATTVATTAEETVNATTIATTTETTVATTIATTVATTTATTVEETVGESWDGPILNRVNGTVKGPSGKETYYNLNMSKVVSIMRNLGYDYEYWVRDDGVKMLGEYIMCAANLKIRPKGTILETSLGTAIVCDTGGFAKSNPHQIDIAVNW